MLHVLSLESMALILEELSKDKTRQLTLTDQRRAFTPHSTGFNFG
jgi:hypothetical protein